MKNSIVLILLVTVLSSCSNISRDLAEIPLNTRQSINANSIIGNWLEINPKRYTTYSNDTPPVANQPIQSDTTILRFLVSGDFSTENEPILGIGKKGTWSIDENDPEKINIVSELTVLTALNLTTDTRYFKLMHLSSDTLVVDYYLHHQNNSSGEHMDKKNTRKFTRMN
jgi:hypothetical protein